ncbi:DUF6542 domain-containing protein [Corynebacterium ciconiae]|uniref:DUF6542 domain-containing protein n=1 Tax=Corynebacterium ciconiae TaxID=227319 RepID=UPI001AD7F9FB|nr:DUF6542 domain-containing protein [Corynebacterium ciconiae]
MPTWSSTSILLASIVTGLVISLNQHTLGTLYLMAFAIGALVTVLLVEPRGLTLTVAQIPVIFGIATPFAALMLNKSNSLSGGDGRLSKTELLTLIYPLAQFFPTLIVVTLSVIAVAVLRYLHHRRNNIKLERKLSAQRKRASDSDRRNLTTTARAREAANRSRRYRGESGSSEVTVEDLLKRSRSDLMEPEERIAPREPHPPREQREAHSPREQREPRHPEPPRRGHDAEEIRSPRVPRPHAPSPQHPTGYNVSDLDEAATHGSHRAHSEPRPAPSRRPHPGERKDSPARGDAQLHRTRRVRRPDHENRFRRLEREERGRSDSARSSRISREPRASRDFSTTRQDELRPRPHSEGYRSEQRGVHNAQRHPRVQRDPQGPREPRNPRASRSPRGARREVRRDSFTVRPEDADSYGFRTHPPRER